MGSLKSLSWATPCHHGALKSPHDGTQGVVVAVTRPCFTDEMPKVSRGQRHSLSGTLHQPAFRWRRHGLSTRDNPLIRVRLAGCHITVTAVQLWENASLHTPNGDESQIE